MGRDHHVERDGRVWIVRLGSRILSTHSTRLAAIEMARRLARFEGGNLVVER